jgi:hypothetical protein
MKKYSKKIKQKDIVTPIVKEIINREDPINLLHLDAPKDEYGSEIQTIAAGIRKCTSIEGIQKLIYATFKDSFGVDVAGEISWYSKIAYEIFTRINSGDTILNY